jgi:hypothetical protein
MRFAAFVTLRASAAPQRLANIRAAYNSRLIQARLQPSRFINRNGGTTLVVLRKAPDIWDRRKTEVR